MPDLSFRPSLHPIRVIKTPKENAFQLQLSASSLDSDSSSSRFSSSVNSMPQASGQWSTLNQWQLSDPPFCTGIRVGPNSINKSNDSIRISWPWGASYAPPRGGSAASLQRLCNYPQALGAPRLFGTPCRERFLGQARFSAALAPLRRPLRSSAPHCNPNGDGELG